MYGRIFNGTIWFSKAQTRWLQTGRLHDYVFMIVVVTIGLLFWAISNYGGWSFSVDWSEYDLMMIGLVLIMVTAAVLAVTANSYMTVLVALGTVGFGVALIFAYYGAPDLAITQLLVETLTVVLFMFVILKLPKLKTLSSGATRIRDVIVASSFGALITVLLLKAISIQFDHAISERLAEMSYPEAKGKNVVNVILVDFRALDTFGEIVVVATAALGIAALVASGLKTRKGGEK
jgi:multicomponent Na+:H+ antiporter subunit A